MVLQFASQAPTPFIALHTGEPLATIGHAVPHFPQLLRSLLRSMQLPLHAAKPLLQATPHEPDAQVGEASSALGQVVSQEPQFFGSVSMTTHEPEQLFWPVGQVSLHVPPEQASLGPQARPHDPQLLGS